MLQLVVIVEQFCLIFALVVVCVVGGVSLLTITGLLFICIQLHRDVFFFSDTVMLKVTDRNGTKIASTNIIIYKCRTAKKYVHVRQNVVVLINQLISINKEKRGKTFIKKL